MRVPRGGRTGGTCGRRKNHPYHHQLCLALLFLFSLFFYTIMHKETSKTCLCTLCVFPLNYPKHKKKKRETKEKGATRHLKRVQGLGFLNAHELLPFIDNPKP